MQSQWVIVQANALSQGQPNDLEFLDFKKRPIVDPEITSVDSGETESPKIYLIEPDTDLNPISATEAPNIELI